MPFQLLELDHSANIGDPASRQFSLDVLIGLSLPRKKISSKYLYDQQGSDLFQEIMAADEYYLTRIEEEIFLNSKEKFAARFSGKPLQVLELGAGDGKKSLILLQELYKNCESLNYFPIDISLRALTSLSARFQDNLPQLEIVGVSGDYFSSLKMLVDGNGSRNIVFFLGSNIGNLEVKERIPFLVTIWEALNAGDYILIGFDLKKDISVLLQAYNDRGNITKRFNLNLLKRINSELLGHFDLKSFDHFGIYDPKIGAMVSYLVSLCEQKVRIESLKRSFFFQAYEPIQVEFSFKFSLVEIKNLAHFCGFSVEELYLDKKSWFASALLKVEKKS